jgi:hypothetical protein
MAKNPDLTAPMVYDDSELKEVPISIGRGDKAKAYILRQPTAEVARKYRNTAIRAARMSDGKLVGIDGAADVEIMLVSECLHELNAEGQVLRLAPVGVIRALPAPIVRDLFDRAKALGRLDEQPADEAKEEEERLGNLPDSGPASSAPPGPSA